MTEVRSRKQIGALGERLAAEFLVGKGFSVVARNYLRPWGEIDIIALKDDVVRFVEVKSVSRESSVGDISREMGDYRPEEMIHKAKIRKIARTAELYMHEAKDPRDYQLDAVVVFLDPEKRVAKCRLNEQIL